MTVRTGRPGLHWLLPAQVVDDEAPTARRSARDWLADAGIAVLAGIATLAISVTVADNGSGLAPAARVVDLAAGWAAYGALWLRRRWPAGLGLAIVPVTMVSLTSVPAQVVIGLNLAIRCRPQVTAGLAALGVGASAIFSLWRPDPGTPYLAEVLFSALVGGLLTGWGLMIRARRQLVASLHERARRAEAEQQLRVQQARQQERTRIAREMHDVLAHRLSLLSLHAGALEYRPDAPAADIARAAGVIRTSAREALEDLREVIGVLRGGGSEPDGAPRRPQPTLADLPGLVEQSRDAGERVRLHQRLPATGTAPPALGRSAYRIVQEGITNARKHAPGATVDVTIQGGPGSGLTIELVNPAPVCPVPAPVPGSGTGLVGLAERASLAGGRLSHGWTAQGQFRLHAWLPWSG